MSQQQPTLLDLIGGPGTVEQVVDRFYDRVADDPILRAIYPEDLAPGRAKLKLFLIQWLGGPPLYSQRFGHPRLRRRQYPFVIDERAAERWLVLMRDALGQAGVPSPLCEVIDRRLTPLAYHMVNANDDVPREPLRTAWLD